MVLNRRQMLSSLALGPLLSLAGGCRKRAVESCTCISILLHGLFFLEYQENTLIVAAPKTPKTGHHKHYLRDHAGQLVKMSGVIDVSDLKATTHVEAGYFPPTMLRFSRDVIGIKSGNYFIDINRPEKYAWLFRFNLPQKIIALRHGQFSDFQPDPSDLNVAKSIKGQHGLEKRVSVITWLQYDPDPEVGYITRSFYAEHKDRPSPKSVNEVLQEVHDNINSAFDLQIKENKQVDPYPCDDVLPLEIDQKDETALSDLLKGNPCYTKPLSPSATVEVASCPQFGVMK